MDFPFRDDGTPILLDDGQTDVSMLVAAPYLLMDGMNEKGLMVAVLTVDGAGTVQAEPGRHSMQTTTALRLALDRAASVPEAIELWKNYNMNASIKEKNFHFFMADAQGHFAVVEYAPDGEMKYSLDDGGAIPNLFADTPPSYLSRLVTNFYSLFPAATYAFDDGERGLDRFTALLADIEAREGRYGEDDMLAALRLVYQDFGHSATHETQWSVVYNPNALTAIICPRVNQTDHVDAFYTTAYHFAFADAFQNGGAITCTETALR